MNHSDLTLFPTDKPNCVCFEFGAPGPELLSLEIVKRACSELSAVYASLDWTCLQYGPQLGSTIFRDNLAKFLSNQYNDDCLAKNLTITSGASQSLFNILAMFTRKCGKFFIEDPTYFLAIKVLQDLGITNLTSIPVDNDGLLVDILERELQSVDASTNSEYSSVLYLVPTFSNPTGTTLSLERRIKLVKLARMYNMLVICDDVYQCFDYSQTPPTRLVSIDLKDCGNGGNVISNCSFSKILAPGLRLGWIEAPPRITEALLKSGLLYSGGCSNHFAASLVNTMILNNSLIDHFNLLKATLRDRMMAMCDFLDENLPNGCSFKRPSGGYFIWIVLPEHWSSFDILSREKLIYKATGDGPYVSFTPGSMFSPSKSFTNCLRLSFAFYPKDKLLKGLERLCKILKSNQA